MWRMPSRPIAPMITPAATSASAEKHTVRSGPAGGRPRRRRGLGVSARQRQRVYLRGVGRRRRDVGLGPWSFGPAMCDLRPVSPGPALGDDWEGVGRSGGSDGSPTDRGARQRRRRRGPRVALPRPRGSLSRQPRMSHPGLGSGVHRSAPAETGPPKDPPKPTAPPPPPAWLHTLWLAGLVMTLLWLFLPAPKSKTTPLAYTAWRAKVGADQVKTATFDPDGKVSGKLVDGTRYTSRLPVALKDDALAAELDQHHVTVDAVGTSTNVWSVIGGLLPFVLLLGVYFWISRGARRQLGGGLMGIGASKAKIYDEQRPTTRFS